MPEIDPLISSYSHLASFPRASDALHTLKKIASLVKPLMRARRWRVGQLTEFYPHEANLLGLNVNRGQKICLRLRYPSDPTLFLPMEQVVDTMLHELAHIVHGPHDGKFHALWDKLRDEHEELAMVGYTGEGFLSRGQRLGGSGILPMDEVRRLARTKAEESRRQFGQQKGGVIRGGQRLGGPSARPGRDMRSVIAEAAIQRDSTISRGCANDKQSAEEIQAIAETATKNGFRTQAEEDAANEAAIAQALWDLVQEDEKKRLGDAYIPPDAYLPLIGDDASSSSPRPADTGLASTSRAGPKATPSMQKPPASSRRWSCTVCTLENPATYLCCDACGTERSLEASYNDAEDKQAGTQPTQRDTNNNVKRKRTETIIDLTGTGSGSVQMRGGKSGSTTTRSSGPMSGTTHALTAPHAKPPAATWTCRFCGRVRERQWWSCDVCGNIKDSSA